MWHKPWKLREGLAIGAGLLITGEMLQLSMGSIDWQLFAFPVNVVALALYLTLIAAAFLLRRKIYVVSYFTTPKAATASILFATVLTALMGITRQVAGTQPAADPIGITKMLSYWPFVLVYLWLTTTIALTTLQQFATFRLRKIPAIVCHIGLFLIVVCGTLGSADMQRLKMYCISGQPEWRALDDEGAVTELPLAIQLNRFILEEYPAEVQKVRGVDGKPTIMKMPTPKRYASEVDIFTKRGDNIQTTIEVNKPISVEGWKIYQYSYDESMGAKSTLSIFELVTDPWLPVVYIGIGLLLLGAVLMFFTLGKGKDVHRKEEENS